MNEVINCVKCGRPLQMVFFGIAHEFAGGVEVNFEDKGRNHWLVCTNPDCEDGVKNVNHGVAEVEI